MTSSATKDALSSPAYFSQGILHIAKVWVEDTGTEHEVTLRLLSHNPMQFELQRIDPPLPGAKPSTPNTQQSFTCNLCGKTATAPLDQIQDREAPSCPHCGSSLRKRALMWILSQRLFGHVMPLPAFPQCADLYGIGMSDSYNYALMLAKKFSYTNTFYHTEPRLDITDIPLDWENHYDFLISTEVFEHIPQPVDRAFYNAFRLLKPGGILIFSVPYKKTGATEEHFPELFDYRIEERDGQQVLVNTTEQGMVQEFTDLKFHGGDGFTLEMRLFSAPHLLSLLQQAGFEDIVIHRESDPEFGVQWGDIDWSLPISARKPT